MSPVYPNLKWWQKTVLRLAATRPASRLLSRILDPLDRLVLRLSKQKYSLTVLLSGIPVIRLTTYGRTSGLARVCTLFAIPVQEGLVVYATNFGARRHPSWYLNLAANPNVLVSLNGTTEAYTARLADEGRRAQYWRLATTLYPGYLNYREWAGERRIPIVELLPATGESSPDS